MFGFRETPRRRREVPIELGVRTRLARNTAGSGLGPWYPAKAKALLSGFPMPVSNRSAFLRWSTGSGVTSRTAVYGPVRTGGVAGVSGQPLPVPVDIRPVFETADKIAPAGK